MLERRAHDVMDLSRQAGAGDHTPHAGDLVIELLLRRVGAIALALHQSNPIS